jgi:hypothetical protein
LGVCGSDIKQLAVDRSLDEGRLLTIFASDILQ